MSKANGKDPKEKEPILAPLDSVLAFLNTLTHDEIERLKNDEPVIKDFAGDAVLVEFSKPFKEIVEKKLELSDYLVLKAMPLMEFNTLSRKKMSKGGF